MQSHVLSKIGIKVTSLAVPVIGGNKIKLENTSRIISCFCTTAKILPQWGRLLCEKLVVVQVIRSSPLLGAFANSQKKSTISSIFFGCRSAWKTRLTMDRYSWYFILENSTEVCRWTFRFGWNRTKIPGNLHVKLRTSVGVLSWIFYELENLWGESCRKKSKYTLYVTYSASKKTCRLRDNYAKYITAIQGHRWCKISWRIKDTICIQIN